MIATLPLAVAIAALLVAAPLAAQDDGTFAVPGAAQEAPPIDGIDVFEVDSFDHVEGTVDYPQDPPAGGLHNPVWQNCGFYDELVSPERAVHSQEHGAVWITVRTDLAESDLDLLRRLAERNEYLLVSPYPGQEEPVVASAWGAQLRLDGAADPRLRAFIRFYAGNGPELGAPCDGASDETLPLPAATPAAPFAATPTA